MCFEINNQAPSCLIPSTLKKIKNEKIKHWQLEMAYFYYDIIYRPGKDNNTADALSRICSVLNNTDTKLKNLHEIL
ncbi:hypothetical protein PR048_009978 [Dryococelus australis]|uniref:Uncharacterized protein n=1 Tax=Dryococelus australis TaxID=614101 RepID=A0ABQ9I2D4_9NEOP|nr:hypothetical protein PR048_009978 [Dryococelus australis]